MSDELDLTGLPHYIDDEDHPLTTWPTYGGIRRQATPALNADLQRIYDKHPLMLTDECDREKLTLDPRATGMSAVLKAISTFPDERLYAAKRKIDYLRDQADALPPMARTIRVDDPKNEFNTLPVRRIVPKRPANLSARQWLIAQKKERREHE